MIARRGLLVGLTGLLVPATSRASTLITSGAMSVRGLGFGRKKATPSTLNPADKASTITLSNGNLTATETGSPSSVFAGVRSTSSRSSGKYHVEFTANTATGPGYPDIGFANATAALSGTTEPGTDTNSVEYQPNGTVFFNNTAIGTGDSWTSSSVIAMEIDIGGLNVWVQKVGGTGRKGPFSIAGMSGPFLVLVAHKFASDAMTVNFGATSFSISPTSGFSAWG